MTATRSSSNPQRLLWSADVGSTDRRLLESAAAGFDLQVRFCSQNDLGNLLRQSGDMIGLELGDDPSNGLAAIRELHVRAPGTAIVVASQNAADMELLRAAMQAGACDVLGLPLVSHELHKALLRLTQATATRAQTQAINGQVITVYGVRGGLGTTTIAVNLAFKLHTVTQGETALVDLDLQRGDAAAFVNLVPVHSLATLATAPGEVDDSFLASVMTRHSSGVAVLAAPAAIEEAELVTEREVELALRVLRSKFAYTVIDTPRTITPAVVAALEDSDRIFILTDLTVPSIRAARRVFELLARLEGPLERTELLVTEIVAGPVELKKASQVLGKAPFAIIPRDETAGSAMNDGIPLNGRPTRLALALDSLARQVAGMPSGAKGGRGLLSRIFPKGARP